jgi:hypothetical protein
VVIKVCTVYLKNVLLLLGPVTSSSEGLQYDDVHCGHLKRVEAVAVVVGAQPG